MGEAAGDGALDGFERALAFTLKWEGGFVCDKRDAGGATNFGISSRFLKGLPLEEGDVDGDGRLTRRDAAALQRSDAARIYKKYFWDALHLDRVPAPLAGVMFDGAVNMGRRRAVLFLQRAVNRLFPDGEPLVEDGIVGRKTMAAVERARRTPEGASALARDVLRRRAAYYGKLAASPKYAWAWKGWMNRTRDLWSAGPGGRCPF